MPARIPCIYFLARLAFLRPPRREVDDARRLDRLLPVVLERALLVRDRPVVERPRLPRPAGDEKVDNRLTISIFADSKSVIQIQAIQSILPLPRLARLGLRPVPLYPKESD